MVGECFSSLIIPAILKFVSANFKFYHFKVPWQVLLHLLGFLWNILNWNFRMSCLQIRADRRTDEPTEGQTGGLTDRQADGRTDGPTDGHTARQANWRTDRRIERPIGGLTDRRIYGLTDWRIDRRTVRPDGTAVNHCRVLNNIPVDAEPSAYFSAYHSDEIARKLRIVTDTV